MTQYSRPYACISQDNDEKLAREIYTHVVNFSTDQYYSATASAIEDASARDDGFEYVTEMGSIKLFMKSR